MQSLNMYCQPQIFCYEALLNTIMYLFCSWYFYHSNLRMQIWVLSDELNYLLEHHLLCEHFLTAKMPLWSTELFKAISSPPAVSQGTCRQCDSSANNLETGKLVYALLTYLIFLLASCLSVCVHRCPLKKWTSTLQVQLCLQYFLK